MTFNENIFSSSANQRIDTKLNGLIIVKRNGIVLFDESEEIKKQVIDYGLCMADFFQKSELFTFFSHF
jgi:urocanate hydratase